MKIAIKGDESRGNEIIQILKDLGGINRMNHSGCYINYFYYISSDDKTIAWTCVRPKCFNVYTLEEFEKEFPFKIGDKVITTYGNVGIIRALTPENDEIPYCIETEKGYIYRHQSELKFYKEMKEERNITLTLEKAKEWYKKGGELKEIALQAYSEEELTKTELPRTWKEFCENYPVKVGETWMGSYDTIYSATMTQSRIYKNWIPSRRSAGAHLALIQLEQLRDCWRQGWIPTPGNNSYAIKSIKKDKLEVCCFCSREFLSFPTKEMAEEFLKCFRDLIEKAGDLI